jgi:hypothetical protein
VLLQGEDEFLFSAYSAFEVVRVHWSPTPQNKALPHEITLRAAPDNRCAPGPSRIAHAPACEHACTQTSLHEHARTR